MAKKKAERSDVPQNETPKPKASGNWYYTGDEGFAHKRQEDAARKLRQEKGIRRFWMKPGVDPKRIVFLDSQGWYIKEHNLKIGGKWGNFVTCIEDFTGDCKVCDKGSYPSYTAYYSIIDTSEYTRQNDGKVIKNQKVLLPAKNTAIYVIEDLKKKYGNLTGMVFDVKRYTKDDPGCGVSFTPVEKNGKAVRVNVAQQLKNAELAVPYDYSKVLAAPTDAEFAALGFGNVHSSIESPEEVTAEDKEELDNLF